jgi:ABC-type sulfate transport system permease subunit
MLREKNILQKKVKLWYRITYSLLIITATLMYIAMGDTFEEINGIFVVFSLYGLLIMSILVGGKASRYKVSYMREQGFNEEAISSSLGFNSRGMESFKV